MFQKIIKADQDGKFTATVLTERNKGEHAKFRI